VKELLSHAGVPFAVRNVELDLAAYKELIALGFRTVPVTFVGGLDPAAAVVGWDERKLRHALNLDPS
jgi:glutaredoxin